MKAENRKKVYNFLKDNGFEVTTERHKKLKLLLVDNKEIRSSKKPVKKEVKKTPSTGVGMYKIPE